MSDGDPKVAEPQSVGIVPHTHWDREWYPRSRPTACSWCTWSTSCSTCSRPIRRSPASCSTARPRSSTTTSRCGPKRRQRLERARRRRAAPGGAVDDPHGRVHGLGRDDRPEPAARDWPAPASSAHTRAPRSATCPTCSVTSRRCPRSCVSPGSSTRWCGGASRRRSRAPRSGGARPTDHACGPSTSTARTPTDATSPTTPPQLVARARGYEAELGAAQLPGGGMLLMNGSDHLLPQPWLGRVVATANAEQDRLPVRGHVARRVRARAAHRRSRRMGRRAAVRRARQRADGGGLEPRRRAPGRGGRRTRHRASRRATQRAAPPRGARTRTRCWTSRGATSCSTARTTPRARAAPTRWSRRCGFATRRPARSATPSAPTPSVTSQPRSTRRRARSWSSTGRPRPRRARGSRAPRRTVPSTSSRSTASRVRPRSWGLAPAEGISTVVVGQKVRWVLEMMRGPELAGARIARVEQDTAADGTVEFTFFDAGSRRGVDRPRGDS